MKTAICAFVALMTSVVAEDQMGFVFELVRHGARAPLKAEYAVDFPVAVGQLTPQGMRQRYLLGRYARERYTEQYQLLDPDFVHGQVYVQSTDVNRTMQSGYSELLGIYPPGIAKGQKLTLGEQQSLTFGRGLPKMSVRDATTINVALGASPLPNGFVSVPIITFVDKNVADDCSFNGCAYANNEVTSKRYTNSNYNDYWWLANFVRDPLAESLGVDFKVMDESSFYEVYDYSDAYVAMEFEGIPFVVANAFDANSYYEMRTMQKIELVGMFTRDTRRLAFSRVMRKPLDQMQNRVNELLGLDFVATPLRYAIYSGHDDQISNMMEWLHPNNVAMDYVLYASQVVFELKFDATCIATKATEDCFSVAVIWNGNDLAFDACQPHALDKNTGCTYKDFKTLMAGIWYDGENASDLDKACDQAVNPFGFTQVNFIK